MTASSSYGTNDVTDRSDDGNDNDGNTTDDVTVVPLAAAQINVIKTQLYLMEMETVLPEQEIQLIT